MGKYMRRKSKISGEVSLMEVPSLAGVLTRAKTLALKNSAVASTGSGAGSYIQLRSRRLVKPNCPNSPKKQKESCVLTKPNKLRVVNSSTLKAESVKSVGSVKNLIGKDEIRQEIGSKDAVNLGIGDEEGSFGENILEIEGTGRTTRETTPCSLIRDPDAINVPGSSTKSTRPTESKYRIQNTTPRHIPSTSEMDEFFTGSEMQQQRLFIEKYNFDPVNDKPLPGRYEWMKLDATKKS
ncbi:hypothetical protein E3N88_16599 [Mikania micrantha]|uniref:Cyclin-dependent kinase inhibitor domain-containing protein n=1 Tax=Mikania micrantha TaxID=192012 RepID=A0A5N6NYW2_9ASTR|nr:hypothetical protein E3N88_16599 [Mikania micrantha]